MPRPRNPQPKYRRHKSSGQAVVTVPGPSGQRRDIYLGAYNSAASKAEYRRVLAELATGSDAPAAAPRVAADATVNELLVRFLTFAAGYYPAGTLDGYKDALGPLAGLYGHTPAREFGPAP